MTWVCGGLAGLSLLLLLWQWLAALRFPLHRRDPLRGTAPGLTLLKPLKGCDVATEACLRSWLAQDYPGEVQILFGVASSDDPVCAIVDRLIREFPRAAARLVVCAESRGANPKVAKLAELEQLARHDLLIVSDADVLAPPDLLTNVLPVLSRPGVGLLSCFYRLANPSTTAMWWEAVAVNADFWSQVLQSQTLKPLDFALGAVMATRKAHLAEIGGFASLRDVLADDYQLGHRIAKRGHRVALAEVVVECWSERLGWTDVWKHQLRWARTIRVCQPLPYFFSILSNGTLWPLIWLAVQPTASVALLAGVCWIVRIASAMHLQALLARTLATTSGHAAGIPTPLLPLVVPLKDLLQTGIWLLAFTANTVEWRGEKLKLGRDGSVDRA